MTTTLSVDDRRRSVFVVHGRNEALRRSLFELLRSLNLKPVEWSHAVASTGQGSPYIGDVLSAAFAQAQAVVVLLSPDDLAKLRDEYVGQKDPDYERELTGQPRPNVLFEAGMAYGRDADRTILVQVGTLRPISDIFGRHVIHLSEAPESRQDLVIRLRSAGCDVDVNGRDWLSAGDFSIGEADVQLPVSEESTLAEAAELDKMKGDLAAGSGVSQLAISTKDRGDGRVDVLVTNVARKSVVISGVSVKDDFPFMVMVDESQLPIVLNPGEEWATQLTSIGGASRTHNSNPGEAIILDTGRNLPVP